MDNDILLSGHGPEYTSFSDLLYHRPHIGWTLPSCAVPNDPYNQIFHSFYRYTFDTGRDRGVLHATPCVSTIKKVELIRKRLRLLSG